MIIHLCGGAKDNLVGCWKLHRLLATIKFEAVKSLQGEWPILLGMCNSS
jgi:hypothetical protein